MIKTFTQAVKYLEGFIPAPDKKHPGSLGLDRMKLLMNLFDNPQNTYPTIHVGGTSGKGSTATIIASILATKYKVGLHTSPHLISITERIRICGSCRWQDISDEEFVRLVNEIEPIVKKVENSILGKPSYFEIVTAMAFLYFKKVKVDFAVIEVGMGGMYDATNVIKPLVAVLTNVGLDHTEVLGDTVEKIAVDKAGIIKPGIQVVTGAGQPSVIKIIEATGKRQKAKVSLLNRDFSFKLKKLGEKGSVFDYFGDHKYKNLKLSLLGEHQVENASLAIRAIEKLGFNVMLNSFQHLNQIHSETLKQVQGDRPKITLDDIRSGLSNIFIPGRLEIVQKHPAVILDGAHNPDKMKALVLSIKKIYPGRNVISVVAIKDDKKSEEMLRQLLKISKKVIFTRFQLTADTGIIKSYDPNELLILARSMVKTKPLLVINDAKDAVEKTIKSAKKDDIILVTGSLYLIGEIRKFLISN